MQAGRWERLAPLTGVVFFVLLIPAFLLGGEPPDADDSTRTVIDFWTSNDDELIIGSIFAALAALFLLWFVGTLRSALRVAEGGTGRLSAIAYGGGLVLVAAAALGAGIQFAAADTAGDVPPAVTQTLSVMNSDVFFPFVVGTLGLLFATGLLTLRTGVLPAWLGWAAIVIGIVGITPAGFFGFIASLVWILVVSIVLYLRQPAAAGPPPRETPAM
jgi:hypothetical protein